MPIRRFLAAGMVLVLAACASHPPKPLNADYHGTELTTARTAAEKLHATQLAGVLQAVPELHDLGSDRFDHCQGGVWDDYDAWYHPHSCMTERTVLLSFAGSFPTVAAKLARALEATGCGEGLRESVAAAVKVPAPGGDVTQLDGSGGRYCKLPPFESGVITVGWSPIAPDHGQRERAFGHLRTGCYEDQNCEFEPLDLDAALRTAPAGDDWIARVRFETTYWQGEPMYD